MQTVISLVLAILLCELLSVSTLQNNMTTQARNFVEAQAGTNANVVNEWLVEDGNIVHTIRNGVAFMNTKDTDQIMDYLEVNLAKDYKNDAGYYAEVSSSLGQNGSYNDHRRRRFCSSSKPAWFCRQDEPYFHRRRRIAGIFGGQGAARRCCGG